ncbi:MAG: hypothetical protein JXA01_02365 [Dehalococcoidia bacterium]|nr:hypothetical protein [Dehalococcoidia bacterium]
MKTLKLLSIIIEISCILSLSVGLITPAPSSGDDLQLKWHQMDTPGSVSNKNDILSPSEVNDLAIGDDKTLYAIDIPWGDNTDGSKAIYKSTDKGISWNDNIGKYLFKSMSAAERSNFRVWNVAVAPDDADLIAVVTNNSLSTLPSSVWLSDDGGISWANSLCPVSSHISKISISAKAGDSRNVAIGTRTGAGLGNVWTMDDQHQNSWENQLLSGDIVSLQYSPDYANDNTIVVIYSDASGTFLTAGVHDNTVNTTNWATLYPQGPIEVTTNGAGNSPKASQIISANLSLPGSYTSRTAIARIYFASIDCPAAPSGIYRIDGTSICRLMIATPQRRISSIAFYGDLTSGILLAGEVLGNLCSASVMTWFTDTPFMCTIPCWYPSLKPPTGAAGTDNCTGTPYGNALVRWSSDGNTAYAGTSSTDTLTGGITWTTPYLTGKTLDESSFSRSINNGETWSQMSLIDTIITNLIDIAPSPDCSRIYLASINSNTGCSGFDSVWMADTLPLGSIWERILCSKTAGDNCTAMQSDEAILRIAGDKPDGQVVTWSAPGTNALKWSSNYGESWNNLYSSTVIQDVAVESSKNMYILDPNGKVSKYVYSRAGWSVKSNIYCGVDPAYSIATAFTGMTPDNDEGIVLVGSACTSIWDAAYSTDAGNHFKTVPKTLPIRDNTMVMASAGFDSDGYIMAINSGGMFAYSIYTSGTDPWEEWWGGPAYPDSITGLSISRNSSYYFCSSSAWGASPYIRWSYAVSGLDPTISFGPASEPSTRFRTCGGLELAQPTITYAIDQRLFSPSDGGVWYYIDDLLWSGPRPTSPVNHFTVSCDPVTGRNGAIELKWLPRSLSKEYSIYIAKDINFYMTVAKIGADYSGLYYTPPDLDHPTLYIPPGGGTIVDSNGDSWTIPPLEVGQSYYWKVKVQSVATGDYITSPWSWRESYDLMPGFKVATSYSGVQLLNPSNGCLECPLMPAFSWSPYQGAVSYKFFLAKDPGMEQIVLQAITGTSSYKSDLSLDEQTAYYWQIQALDSQGKSISSWSATFCFSTESTGTLKHKTRETGPVTPIWVWAVLIISLALVIITLILIIKSNTMFY